MVLDLVTAVHAAPAAVARQAPVDDFDAGDGSIVDAYAAATGVPPQPALLELYRICWDLKDLAEYVSRFRRPHTGTADDDKSWAGVHSIVHSAAEPSRE